MSQSLAPSQLSKGHAHKLAPAGKLAYLVVTSIPGDAAMKLLWVNPVEQLSQNVFSGVHCRKIVEPELGEAQIDHTPEPSCPS